MEISDASNYDMRSMLKYQRRLITKDVWNMLDDSDWSVMGRDELAELLGEQLDSYREAYTVLRGKYVIIYSDAINEDDIDYMAEKLNPSDQIARVWANSADRDRKIEEAFKKGEIDLIQKELSKEEELRKTNETIAAIRSENRRNARLVREFDETKIAFDTKTAHIYVSFPWIGSFVDNKLGFSYDTKWEADMFGASKTTTGYGSRVPENNFISVREFKKNRRKIFEYIKSEYVNNRLTGVKDDRYTLLLDEVDSTFAHALAEVKPKLQKKVERAMEYGFYRSHNHLPYGADTLQAQSFCVLDTSADNGDGGISRIETQCEALAVKYMVELGLSKDMYREIVDAYYAKEKEKRLAANKPRTRKPKVAKT
jgi:hypothetical protein